MTPLDFSATTLRVTSTDEERFLTPIGELVLADVQARLRTRHDTLESVYGRWGSIAPNGHPDEWDTLEVEIRGTGPRGLTIHDDLQDVTVTSECALEAWGPQSAGGSWPVLVVPSLGFETMGCGGSFGPEDVWFSGRLYSALWGLTVKCRQPPWASDGRRRPFAGALPTESGELWRVGTTQVPPPKAGPVPLRATAYREVPGAIPWY